MRVAGILLSPVLGILTWLQICCLASTFSPKIAALFVFVIGPLLGVITAIGTIAAFNQAVVTAERRRTDKREGAARPDRE